MPHHVSDRVTAAAASLAALVKFMRSSPWATRAGEANTADFVLGNPHEMPLDGYVSALQKAVVPQSVDWFAYRSDSLDCREIVAKSLQEWRGVPFAAEDILMTTGAFGALATILMTVVSPDEEVIVNTPHWFFYEAHIAAYGGRMIRVPTDRRTFDLDVGAIERALTERTRAVIVNSPNNPTGKIYSPETLEALSKVLTAASRRFSRKIYLLSDEAYSRIVFDGREFPSPTRYYPDSLLFYTYGKTLLTPGERLGYIALPPEMSERGVLREGLKNARFVAGYAVPGTVLQRALRDIDTLSIDIARIQRRRDRVVSELKKVGYEVTVPEGTFYILVRTPQADDVAFSNELAKHGVFVLPGALIELPGYIRISLTANDEMVELGLKGFARARRS